MPGVNNRGGFGRRAFAGMTDVREMEEGLAAKVREGYDAALSGVVAQERSQSRVACTLRSCLPNPDEPR